MYSTLVLSFLPRIADRSATLLIKSFPVFYQINDNCKEKRNFEYNPQHNFPSFILTMEKKKCIFSLQGRYLSPVSHSSNLLINSATVCMSWITAVMRSMLARRFSLPFFFFFPIGISSFLFSLFPWNNYIIPSL